MNLFEKNLNDYINQYDIDKILFQKGKEIKKRGYLKKLEFLSICLWKSRRPKNLYNLNTEKEIITQTKLALSEKDEIKKIHHLIHLKGVQIATASAILSVVNPEKYPIIDIRCILSLKDLKVIDFSTITEKNWIKYLIIIRDLANKHNKTAREIEKGLFAYNRIKLDSEYKNLYN